MLLFDDTKKLEKAFGEEAAATLVHVLEKMSEESKRELVTKGHLDLRLAEMEARTKADLKATETKLMTAIANSKVEMMKWGVGVILAQTALIAALVKLL
ncbi:MAG: hypothetical protein LBV80_09880 [Deltaproteobacteria bacterium]|jgi:citrate lyase gamma subunit|nr:hypothetical protein [Deltaproteobacteria bacterium]